MYQGGCLCGAVRFEIHGSIRNIVYCHCSECRKAQGSAYATNGIVSASDFHIIAGEKSLTRFAFSEEQDKYFCRHCGSPIMSRNCQRPGQVRIRLGTLESDINEHPSAHIFVASRAGWEILPDDGLPHYDGHEPGR